MNVAMGGEGGGDSNQGMVDQLVADAEQLIFQLEYRLTRDLTQFSDRFFSLACAHRRLQLPRRLAKAHEMVNYLDPAGNVYGITTEEIALREQQLVSLFPGAGWTEEKEPPARLSNRELLANEQRSSRKGGTTDEQPSAVQDHDVVDGASSSPREVVRTSRRGSTASSGVGCVAVPPPSGEGSGLLRAVHINAMQTKANRELYYGGARPVQASLLRRHSGSLMKSPSRSSVHGSKNQLVAPVHPVSIQRQLEDLQDNDILEDLPHRPLLDDGADTNDIQNSSQHQIQKQHMNYSEKASERSVPSSTTAANSAGNWNRGAARREPSTNDPSEQEGLQLVQGEDDEVDDGPGRGEVHLLSLAEQGEAFIVDEQQKMDVEEQEDLHLTSGTEAEHNNEILKEKTSSRGQTSRSAQTSRSCSARSPTSSRSTSSVGGGGEEVQENYNIANQVVVDSPSKRSCHGQHDQQDLIDKKAASSSMNKISKEEGVGGEADMSRCPAASRSHTLETNSRKLEKSHSGWAHARASVTMSLGVTATRRGTNKKMGERKKSLRNTLAGAVLPASGSRVTRRTEPVNRLNDISPNDPDAANIKKDPSNSKMVAEEHHVNNIVEATGDHLNLDKMIDGSLLKNPANQHQDPDANSVSILQQATTPDPTVFNNVKGAEDPLLDIGTSIRKNNNSVETSVRVANEEGPSTPRSRPLVGASASSASDQNLDKNESGGALSSARFVRAGIQTVLSVEGSPVGDAGPPGGGGLSMAPEIVEGWEFREVFENLEERNVVLQLNIRMVSTALEEAITTLRDCSRKHASDLREDKQHSVQKPNLIDHSASSKDDVDMGNHEMKSVQSSRDALRMTSHWQKQEERRQRKRRAIVESLEVAEQVVGLGGDHHHKSERGDFLQSPQELRKVVAQMYHNPYAAALLHHKKPTQEIKSQAAAPMVLISTDLIWNLSGQPLLKYRKGFEWSGGLVLKRCLLALVTFHILGLVILKKSDVEQEEERQVRLGEAHVEHQLLVQNKTQTPAYCKSVRLFHPFTATLVISMSIFIVWMVSHRMHRQLLFACCQTFDAVLVTLAIVRIAMVGVWTHVDCSPSFFGERFIEGVLFPVFVPLSSGWLLLGYDSIRLPSRLKTKYLLCATVFVAGSLIDRIATLSKLMAEDMKILEEGRIYLWMVQTSLPNQELLAIGLLLVVMLKASWSILFLHREFIVLRTTYEILNLADMDEQRDPAMKLYNHYLSQGGAGKKAVEVATSPATTISHATGETKPDGGKINGEAIRSRMQEDAKRISINEQKGVVAVSFWGKKSNHKDKLAVASCDVVRSLLSLQLSGTEGLLRDLEDCFRAEFISFCEKVRVFLDAVEQAHLEFNQGMTSSNLFQLPLVGSSAGGAEQGILQNGDLQRCALKLVLFREEILMLSSVIDDLKNAYVGVGLMEGELQLVLPDVDETDHASEEGGSHSQRGCGSVEELRRLQELGARPSIAPQEELDVVPSAREERSGEATGAPPNNEKMNAITKVVPFDLTITPTTSNYKVEQDASLKNVDASTAPTSPVSNIIHFHMNNRLGGGDVGVGGQTRLKPYDLAASNNSSFKGMSGAAAAAATGIFLSSPGPPSRAASQRSILSTSTHIIGPTGATVQKVSSARLLQIALTPSADTGSCWTTSENYAENIARGVLHGGGPNSPSSSAGARSSSRGGNRGRGSAGSLLNPQILRQQDTAELNSVFNQRHSAIDVEQYTSHMKKQPAGMIGGGILIPGSTRSSFGYNNDIIHYRGSSFNSPSGPQQGEDIFLDGQQRRHSFIHQLLPLNDTRRMLVCEVPAPPEQNSRRNSSTTGAGRKMTSTTNRDTTSEQLPLLLEAPMELQGLMLTKRMYMEARERAREQRFLHKLNSRHHGSNSRHASRHGSAFGQLPPPIMLRTSSPKEIDPHEEMRRASDNDNTMNQEHRGRDNYDDPTKVSEGGPTALPALNIKVSKAVSESSREKQKSGPERVDGKNVEGDISCPATEDRNAYVADDAAQANEMNQITPANSKMNSHLGRQQMLMSHHSSQRSGVSTSTNDNSHSFLRKVPPGGRQSLASSSVVDHHNTASTSIILDNYGGRARNSANSSAVSGAIFLCLPGIVHPRARDSANSFLTASIEELRQQPPPPARASAASSTGVYSTTIQYDAQDLNFENLTTKGGARNAQDLMEKSARERQAVDQHLDGGGSSRSRSKNIENKSNLSLGADHHVLSAEAAATSGPPGGPGERTSGSNINTNAGQTATSKSKINVTTNKRSERAGQLKAASILKAGKAVKRSYSAQVLDGSTVPIVITPLTRVWDLSGRPVLTSAFGTRLVRSQLRFLYTIFLGFIVLCEVDLLGLWEGYDYSTSDTNDITGGSGSVENNMTYKSYCRARRDPPAYLAWASAGWGIWTTFLYLHRVHKPILTASLNSFESFLFMFTSLRAALVEISVNLECDPDGGGLLMTVLPRLLYLLVFTVNILCLDGARFNRRLKGSIIFLLLALSIVRMMVQVLDGFAESEFYWLWFCCETLRNHSLLVWFTQSGVLLKFFVGLVLYKRDFIFLHGGYELQNDELSLPSGSSSAARVEEDRLVGAQTEGTVVNFGQHQQQEEQDGNGPSGGIRPNAHDLNVNMTEPESKEKRKSMMSRVLSAARATTKSSEVNKKGNDDFMSGEGAQPRSFGGINILASKESSSENSDSSEGDESEDPPIGNRFGIASPWAM